MTEDLRHIVVGVNRLLHTDYNLISLDALSIEGLLQLLVNCLANLSSLPKFDVKKIESDDAINQILQMLRKIQYQPTYDANDPGHFRRGLQEGDKKTIYPIIKWILDNQERVQQTAYLARYLMPPDIPTEALAMPEIGNLHKQYEEVVENFKDAYKTHQLSLKSGARTRELKNDKIAIELEIENVQKRIERTQVRLQKIPQHELLLGAAKNLYQEKERYKELGVQIEEQYKGLQRAHAHKEVMQKELNSLEKTLQETTPHQLLESLMEENQVLEFMVQEKLPQEIKQKEIEIALLQEIISEPNISFEYLGSLQGKIDEIQKEIQELMEARMKNSTTHNDELGPFRQQASIVDRKYDSAVESLDQMTKKVRELDEEIQEKNAQLKSIVGEPILRGDELKEYVNTLRAKSSLYKQRRSELASAKTEVADLIRTLENLKVKDPSIAVTLDQIGSDENIGELDSRTDPFSETQSTVEHTKIIEGLQTSIAAARQRIMPIAQKLRPIQKQIDDLEENCIIKKQGYDGLNAILAAETAKLKSEITDEKRMIKQLEEKWQQMKAETERAELLLEKAKDDSVAGVRANSISLVDSLTQKLTQMETMCDALADEKLHLDETQTERVQQQEMWDDVAKLLEVKLKCITDAQSKGIGGTLSVHKGTETFTLQE